MENKNGLIDTVLLRQNVIDTYYRCDVEYTFLHDLYFFLYDSLFKKGIEVNDLQFLKFFLSYLNHKKSLLYNTFHEYNEEEQKKLKTYFINMQIDIRKLDLLMEYQGDLYKIQEYYDKEINPYLIKACDVDFREIMTQISKNFFYNKPTRTFSRRQKMTIMEIFKQVSANINGWECSEIEKDIIDTKMFESEKKKTLQKIDLFKIVLEEYFGDERKKSHIRESFIEEIYKLIILDSSKSKSKTIDIFTNAYQKEVLFKCYAEPSNRKKIDTRIKNIKKNELYTKNKEYLSVYAAIIKNSRKDMSYLPQLFIGIYLGLEDTKIKALCEMATKNLIKNSDFDKVFNKFKNIYLKRDLIEEYFIKIDPDNFEHITEQYLKAIPEQYLKAIPEVNGHYWEDYLKDLSESYFYDDIDIDFAQNNNTCTIDLMEGCDMEPDPEKYKKFLEDDQQ